jgi:beta-fructofuranosidase
MPLYYPVFFPLPAFALFMATVLASTMSARDAGSSPPADIVLADFEGYSYAPWRASGKAFGSAPARPGAAGRISGFSGSGLASSVSAREKWQDDRGSLCSPEFVVSRPYINFLVGGGDHAFRAAVTLWIDGRAVRTSSGNNSDRLEWKSWDVREFEGRPAWIGIHDLCIEDEPGHVLVDEIRLSTAPMTEPGGDVGAAIAQVRREAVRAIARNAPVAARDPWRPVYHYTPPAQRMNDPNGPAWHDGWHHVFYQHMVFHGSGPAMDVHWGHARSRDLVNWETLPLAIFPSYELGENSVFSGNMARDKQDDPVQFTTMVPYLPRMPRRVWAARPLDAEWRIWRKIAENPPPGLVPEGDPLRNIKDPYPFSIGDRRFLVLTDKNISVYEATDDLLTRWKYRGAIDKDSAECPNFFEVDGHWVYLASPHSPPRYRVGTFDPDTCEFTPRVEGRLNRLGGFYATTACRDDKGRTILYGVTRGQKGGLGWTGALAMPRILRIGDDGRPRMSPPPELETLRRDHFSINTSLKLKNKTRVIDGLAGDTLEIVARFKSGGAKAFGLRVRRSDDGARYIPVMWKNGEIVVQKRNDKFPCEYTIEPAAREVVLRVFLDKGILDACTGDGRVFESCVHYAPLEDLGVEVFAEGGTATLISFDAWRMAPAKIDHSGLLD